MTKKIRTKGARKPKRIVKGKPHTIHVRNLDDETYEALWALRNYIGAFDWVDVVKWVIEKHQYELEALEMFP